MYLHALSWEQLLAISGLCSRCFPPLYIDHFNGFESDPITVTVSGLAGVITPWVEIDTSRRLYELQLACNNTSTSDVGTLVV